jgi:hypothetical protein
MPKAHDEHVRAIAAKLRARGFSSDEIATFCEAEELETGDDPVLRGLAQCIAAIGREAVMVILAAAAAGG